MSAWRNVRLGDVAKLDDGDWIETKDQGGDDYRLLQVSNIGLGRFRETGKFRYVTAQTFDRLRCTQIEPGMVLVARMPEPVGRAWFVQELTHPAITSVDVAIISPNDGEVDGRFLAYLLNAPSRLAEWEVASGGTTRKRITRRQLEAAEVELPDLHTQQRLASVLGAIDDLIENNRRRVELLEQMARAIYREWFVHFRFPGHEDATFVDSSLGPIPEGWKVMTLGDAASWLSGGTPRTTVGEYWDGDIPWITSGSLTSMLLDRSERMVTAAGLANGTRLVERNTLLFVVRGMSLVREFRVGIADVPLAFGQDCKALIARDGTEPLYLAFSVITMAEEIQGMSELAGHGTGKLSTDRVKAIELPKPPTEVQRTFVGIVHPLRETMSRLRCSRDQLERLRDLLLPKLVTGQIDVSELDLDALVESVA